MDDRVGSTGNSLVALAMVVGTDVEDVMVFAVVPAHQLFVVPVAALPFLLFSSLAEVLFDLCEQPAAGDDGMCLQQLFRSLCVHFRGNDAGQVFFYIYLVDDHNPVFTGHQVERSFEALIFLSLPVEVATYGDSLQFERRGWGGRFKEYLFEQFPVKNDIVVYE